MRICIQDLSSCLFRRRFSGANWIIGGMANVTRWFIAMKSFRIYRLKRWKNNNENVRWSRNLSLDGTSSIIRWLSIHCFIIPLSFRKNLCCIIQKEKVYNFIPFIHRDCARRETRKKTFPSFSFFCIQRLLPDVGRWKTYRNLFVPASFCFRKQEWWRLKIVIAPLSWKIRLWSTDLGR